MSSEKKKEKTSKTVTDKLDLVAVSKGQKKFTGGKKEEYNFKEWKSVSQGCIHIFNGKKLSNGEFVKMFETIRTISNTEVGLTYMVAQYYEEQILRRGMVILRDELKDKPGHTFLVKLGEIWTNFYQNILPTLQALFCSIPTHGMTVKQMTLLSFRDIVVLKIKLDEALSVNDSYVPKAIKQMFCLLLQAIHDYNDNYIKLETLAAKVINPLLGSQGLYIRSEVQEKNVEKHDKFTTQPPAYDQSPEIPVEETKRNTSPDDEFDELLDFRRNRYKAPHRLSCVEEKEAGISESLASLIADGFEIG